MTVALSLQIITSFLLITTTTSSPHGFTIDLIQRRTNSSSSRPSNPDGSSPYANTVYDSFTYLMKLKIGTPPVEIEATIDTGSNIIRTQCLPCLHCYDQEVTIFDPSKSSTYKEKNPYEIIYVDKSYSKGTLATGLVSSKSSGMVGLNLGALSLISQMGDDFLGFRIGTKSDANSDQCWGEPHIERLGTEFHSLEGNIIIDSGTANTYLHDRYCNQVKVAVDILATVKQTAFPGETLCYDTDNIGIFPVVTMHFLGGADLVLDRQGMYVDMGRNYFVAITCVGPTEDAIFGNIAQNNWLVGYDTYSQLVSFKSTDCSALWSSETTNQECVFLLPCFSEQYETENHNLHISQVFWSFATWSFLEHLLYNM
ncbi:unnamed protein product [Arabis nemorensis]|uniref:Peptidase A1 domain-containing protein n=1 Tax=Arabis nemorensis TaxID=586526 RepID=A0A565BMQ9_9BRAS|nr:unnamed protein product [Arabis nemorensis]